MQKLLSKIYNFLESTKDLAIVLLKLSPLAILGCILSDIVFGTSTGVRERTLEAFSSIGVSGTFLTVCIAVVIVIKFLLWWEERKKA